MIKRLFFRLFGILGMIGFYFFIRYMVTGVDKQFGDGFGVGVMFQTVLIWAAWKVSPESFLPRRDK